MRYMLTFSWFNHDGAERAELSSNARNARPLFLMRDVDVCGKNDFRRGILPCARQKCVLVFSISPRS